MAAEQHTSVFFEVQNFRITLLGRVAHSETEGLCPIRNFIIIFIMTILLYDAIMKPLKH